MLNLQNPDETEPKSPSKTKRKPKATESKDAAPPKDGAFAQARKIFWADPKQDRATFLAACAAIGMNPATAKTRYYCLTTDRDASCANAELRGV